MINEFEEGLSRSGGHPRYGCKAMQNSKKRSRRYRHILDFSKSVVRKMRVGRVSVHN